MRHEVCTVPFDLLVRRYGAEYNLGKFPSLEGSIGNTTNNLQRVLDDGDRKMGLVVHQSSDVVFGHFRQLLLEYALEAGEDDVALSGVVVIDHTKLDNAILLFNNSGFFGKAHEDWSLRRRRGLFNKKLERSRTSRGK